MKCDTCKKKLVGVWLDLNTDGEWYVQCSSCPVPGVESMSYQMDEYTVKHLDQKIWIDTTNWAVVRERVA